MRVGLAAIVLISLLALCPASAAPSFLGYTGVLATPNTQLVGEDSVDLGIHSMPDASFLMGSPTVTPFTATFGATDNVEITAAFISRSGGSGDDDFTFHLKYAVLNEPNDEVGLAVGLIDVLDQLGNSVPIYVALSKDLSGKVANCGPVPLTIGLMFADEPPPLVSGTSSADEIQFFASATADIHEAVTALVEVLDDQLNFGVRFNVENDVHVDVGSMRDEFVWGVSYHTMW
jgi:hypothetical protein